ncbi:MAG: hypothetical protein H7844_00490 [Nitrospirae bacterium YQR-1]
MNTKQPQIVMIMFLCIAAAMSIVFGCTPEPAVSPPKEPPKAAGSPVNIEEIVKQVKTAPTDKSNISQRMEALNLWAKSMMVSGVNIDGVLPPERGRKLEALANENSSEAYKMLDAIYADVEKFINQGAKPQTQYPVSAQSYSDSSSTTSALPSAAPAPQYANNPQPAQPVMPPAEGITGLLAQSKKQSTTPANLNDRVVILQRWAQAMVAKRANIDSVFPREKSIQLDELSRRDPAEAAKFLDSILKDLDKFLATHPELTGLRPPPGGTHFPPG